MVEQASASLWRSLRFSCLSGATTFSQIACAHVASWVATSAIKPRHPQAQCRSRLGQTRSCAAWVPRVVASPQSAHT